MSKNNEYLYVVSSKRDYLDSDESYFGADSIHLTPEKAVAAIDADMDETLKEDFADYGIDEVTVDRDGFTITTDGKRFSWSIDPIIMPNGLARTKD